MKSWKIAVLATVLGWLAWGQVFADGTFIAAANRTDMVYDGSRGIIYVANGTEVLRYGMGCGCTLDPITVGSNLEGIDLSPDGKTLAVADNSNDGSNVWVYLIDPDTLAVTKASVVRKSVLPELGSYGVAFLGDGSLLVSYTYNSSGWTPIRRLNLSSMTWTMVVGSTPSSVTGATLFSISSNGQVAGLGETNISDGRWAVFYPGTNTLVSRLGYTDGTSAYNYDIGTNADGTQFAFATTYGTYVYNASYQKIATLSTSSSDMATGVAYDPTGHLAYFPWKGTGDVRVYDMQTLSQVGSYNFEDDFEHGSAAYTSFIQGRTRVSRDGTLLMVSVTGGVRFLDLLTASPVTASSLGGRIRLTLPATAVPVRVAYGLASQPAHGQAFISGDQLTYVPDPGFTGTDTFSYAVEYNHVINTAPVTIDVTADTSAYNPTVSFDTLPALQAATPVPGSARVPGDFNGDGTSDMLWFNPGSSQLGYWTMSTDASGAVKRTGGRTFNITSGYFIGAAGDLDGDGYTDLVFTSANHDLWLWTNSRTGGFSSRRMYDYPADWQLIGAGDVNGDGKDDLLWLNPSTCQFAYWLMDGPTRIGARIVSVACGYYPTSVGYYTPSKRLSILWTSAAGDLYMWDAQASGGFRSYNLSSIYPQLGQNTATPRGRWAIGGGTAGQDIGIEWYDPATRTGFGASLTRVFDNSGAQTGVQSALTWSGSQSLINPASGGYLVKGTGASASALYVIDDGTLSTGTINGLQGGSAPQPDGARQWSYPDGWQVVGAPANGAYPLPWR